MEGVAISASLGGDQRALLGGAVFSGCAAANHAAVYQVSNSLNISRIYLDTQVGDSQVDGLANLGNGNVLVASQTASVLNFQKETYISTSGTIIHQTSSINSGMIIVLHDGIASEPLYVDGGLDVFVGPAVIRRKGVVAISAALGERAAVLGVSVGGTPGEQALH
jgi:hypothetical protein